MSGLSLQREPFPNSKIRYIPHADRLENELDDSFSGPGIESLGKSELGFLE